MGHSIGHRMDRALYQSNAFEGDRFPQQAMQFRSNFFARLDVIKPKYRSLDWLSSAVVVSGYSVYTQESIRYSSIISQNEYC